MKKSKQLISIVMIVLSLSLVLALTACGGGSKSKDPEALKKIMVDTLKADKDKVKINETDEGTTIDYNEEGKMILIIIPKKDAAKMFDQTVSVTSSSDTLKKVKDDANHKLYVDKMDALDMGMVYALKDDVIYMFMGNKNTDDFINAFALDKAK